MHNGRARDSGVLQIDNRNVDVAQTKLVAFAISSFLAGMGGAMLAYLRGQLSGDSFSVFVSLSLVAFAYLGGIGLVSGALLAGAIAPGGLVVGLMDAGFGGENLDTYANLLGGIGLIVTAIFNTDGIAGKVARDLQSKRARRELEQSQAVQQRTMEAAI
jgi:branched-chain amino acid transport system permease protein